MKKLSTLFCLILLAGSIMFTGCKKDEESVVLPTISLKSVTGYISANTQAAYGDTLNFGINAKANGTDNLVKINVYVNNEQLLDSTINTQNFAFDFYSVKTVSDSEVWKFEIKDIAGNVVSTSVTITGNFGQINTYSGITLGAQDNTTIESFISFNNNTDTKYFQAAAFDHQADIDMFCFYEYSVDHPNYMSLAAPGSGITGVFTGSTSPELYDADKKNVTYFEKTTLTTAQFDAVTNDAVILASFDPTVKRKKASVLTVGDVYAFLLHSGKFGLLKITTVTPSPNGALDGSFQMDVKIQK